MESVNGLHTHVKLVSGKQFVRLKNNSELCNMCNVCFMCAILFLLLTGRDKELFLSSGLAKGVHGIATALGNRI